MASAGHHLQPTSWWGTSLSQWAHVKIPGPHTGRPLVVRGSLCRIGPPVGATGHVGQPHYAQPGGPAREGSPPVRGGGPIGGPVWGTRVGGRCGGHQPGGQIRPALREKGGRARSPHISDRFPQGGDGLGRHPPIALLAPAYADAYERARRARDQGVKLTAKAKVILGRQARQRALLEWQRHLADPTVTSGRRFAEAVHPCLAEWLDRGWGGVTFRMAQVLSGHGCFGEYLSRIGRERGPRCHHCGADRDTAQHTLEECPSWAGERRVLVNRIGGDLSLPSVVRAIVGSERSWCAFASFCEEVISRKEAAERVREVEDPDRQPRGGGRGRGAGRARPG
ncbi:uncharacterized protein LOC113561598 [Ooceraea biroi]|uniref:uncharacterized protein LOC113561598 n=1 Tax=Ooceraea biroi TaxID=2015173 RepID=UPI000F08D27A|nr:uncharacterized protein LOC113561598 [Ooceraea biroi]